jgi:hypothetical protein
MLGELIRTSRSKYYTPRTQFHVTNRYGGTGDASGLLTRYPSSILVIPRKNNQKTKDNNRQTPERRPQSPHTRKNTAATQCIHTIKPRIQTKSTIAMQEIRICADSKGLTTAVVINLLAVVDSGPAGFGNLVARGVLRWRISFFS